VWVATEWLRWGPFGGVELDLAHSPAPQPSVDSIRPADLADNSVIAQKNIFGKIGVKPPPVKPVNAQKPTTQLPLTLIGVFSGESPPYVIIENKSKQLQDVFSIGDTIFGEAKLISIRPQQIEIDRQGTIEVLKLDEELGQGVEYKDGIAQVGETEFMVAEDELNKALENLPLLLTQARAVPYFKDGKPIGVRLYAVKPESIFSKLGLRNGDILKSINGNNLDDFNQAVRLFEKLRAEKEISVTLERNSQTKEFKYKVS